MFSVNAFTKPIAYEDLGLSGEAINKLEQTDFILLSNLLIGYVAGQPKDSAPLNEELLSAIYLKSPLGKYGYNTLFNIYFLASLREDSGQKAFEKFQNYLLTLQNHLNSVNEDPTDFLEAGQQFVTEHTADRNWKEKDEDVRADLIAYASAFSLPLKLIDMINARKLIEKAMESSTPMGDQYLYIGLRDSQFSKQFDLSTPAKVQWLIDQLFQPAKDKLTLNLEPFYRGSVLFEKFSKLGEDLRGLEELKPDLEARINHANKLVRGRSYAFLEMLIHKYDQSKIEIKMQISKFLTDSDITEALPDVFTKRDADATERNRVSELMSNIKAISEQKAKAEADRLMGQVLKDQANASAAKKQATDWFRCQGYLD